MKILKKPENLIFDTENPEKTEFNLEPISIPIPLHHSTDKTDWDFLSQYFKQNDGIEHPIFNNFGESYFFAYPFNSLH